MIFRSDIMLKLGKNERVEADDNYIDEASQYIRCLKSFVEDDECKLMVSRVRNRQESGNSRFNYWKLLIQLYGYEVRKHGGDF